MWIVGLITRRVDSVSTQRMIPCESSTVITCMILENFQTSAMKNPLRQINVKNKFDASILHNAACTRIVILGSKYFNWLARSLKLPCKS